MAIASFNPDIDEKPPLYEGDQNIDDAWPFYLAGASIDPIVGDNLTELVGQLPNMPHNYADLGPEAAAEARIEASVVIAENWQEIIAAQAVLVGAWDHEQEPPELLEALIYAGRTDPVVVDTWNHPVTMILPAALYAPYSNIPLPIGNVKVIDPRDDKTFLDSLNDLGIIDFRVHRSF